MTIKDPPEFYTGAPVDPIDLRFRDGFLAELWEALGTKHLVLTAARRTGKTSVMDHMRDHPRNGFSVVSINVQDLTHPADFFLTLLDALHDARPDLVRELLTRGWKLLTQAVRRVDEVGVGDFKIALRESDPDWRENWRNHGTEFLKQARKTDVRILFVVDELPDMLLNLSRNDKALLREFLAWFRTQRLNPAPTRDSLRWLLGGSVNLAGTLDALGLVDLINDVEDIPLPLLTDHDVEVFVKGMLEGRGVALEEGVSARIAARLGRPIPLSFADGDARPLQIVEKGTTHNRRGGCGYRLRCADNQFWGTHPAATLLLPNRQVLLASKEFDRLRLARAGQHQPVRIAA